MRKLFVGAALLVLTLDACKKTGDNEYQIKTPTIGTDTHTVVAPSVEMQKDTINTPVVGSRPETLIVQKPVVGTKKTEVSVPHVVKKP